MIEVVCNDRLGKKVRVKCNEDDTIGDLKKLIAAQVNIRYISLRVVTSVFVRLEQDPKKSEFRSGTQYIKTILHWRIMRFTMVWVWNCIIIRLSQCLPFLRMSGFAFMSFCREVLG